MQPSSDYTLLFPRQIDWDVFQQKKPDVPFADCVVAFLNALSSSLLKDAQSRMFPDVITFAFFCRKASLMTMKEQYAKDTAIRLGRGILFHIAPSNVPINFGYSLVAGLLAGNLNIVRVSSKPFPQVDLIVKHLLKLSENGQYEEVVDRIVLVRYDRTSDVNAYFSSICNVRVIWGGDSTIAEIRKNAIPPRSYDVCFADRYSIALINPEAVVNASDSEIKKLAEAFYNDTYLFDQNACSAPHTIFWLRSEHLKEAQERFWTAVYENASAKYELQPVMSVDKLTAFYRQAVCMDIRKKSMPDNLIVRAELSELSKNIEDFRCSCGYFSEYVIDRLDEIAPVINIKYQSLGYYGFSHEDLAEFIMRNRLQGLDRIVPIGETTAFALTWDGFNLIDTFSRVATVL